MTASAESHVPLNPGAFPLHAPLGRVLCHLALFLHVQTAEERKTESAPATAPHCPPRLPPQTFSRCGEDFNSYTQKCRIISLGEGNGQLEDLREDTVSSPGL